MKEGQFKIVDPIDSPANFSTNSQGIALICNGSCQPTITGVTVDAVSVNGSTTYLTETAATLVQASGITSGWSFTVPGYTLPVTTSTFQGTMPGMGGMGQGGPSDSFIRLRVRFYENGTLTKVTTHKIYISSGP